MSFVRRHVLILFVFLLVLSGCGRIGINRPSKKEFPVRGLDVSHHQGEINWKKVGKTEIEFVYIKATEGGDFKDTRFQENWKEAGEAGLRRGAYHFFTFCKTGKEQAANYIQSVPVEIGSLPPAIDLELGGNCSKRPPKEDVVAELRSFINEMKRVYEMQPIIYVTYDSYNKYLIGELEEIDLWFRDIQRRPSLPDDRPWKFWQYTNFGKCKGIKGRVDKNTFDGSLEEFQSYLAITGNR